MKLRKHSSLFYEPFFLNWKGENLSFWEELRKLNPPLPSCLFKWGRVASMIMMILGLYLLNGTTSVTISNLQTPKKARQKPLSP